MKNDISNIASVVLAIGANIGILRMLNETDFTKEYEVNQYFLQSCDFQDSLDNQKYLETVLPFSKKDFNIIRRISEYKFNDNVYSYEVVSVKIKNGIQKDGILVAHMCPFRFNELKKALELFNDVEK